MKSNLPWIVGFTVLILLSVVSIFFTYIYLFGQITWRNPVEPKPPLNICPIQCLPECQVEEDIDVPECLVPVNGSDTTQNYYNDTIYYLSPNGEKAVVATVTRTGIEDKYKQTTRISYFDGEEWDRNVIRDQKTTSKEVVTNDLLKTWSIFNDDDKIMVKSVILSFDLGDNLKVGIDSKDLKSEMVLRNEPSYTKFFSSSEGQIAISGPGPNKNLYVQDGNILHSRIYSDDASKVLIYDDDFPFQTDWLVFWDEDGGFYHVDVTEVDGFVDNYKSHAIAYYIDPESAVRRSYNIQVQSDDREDPSNAIYNLSGTIGKTISANHQNNFKKYPILGYPWLMGLTKGTVTTSEGEILQGVGIYEYILSE